MKPILHAVAYEKLTRSGWFNDIVYLHAVDVGDARLKFYHVRRNQRGRINVVGVAPVIGYKVEDDHGEVLSV